MIFVKQLVLFFVFPLFKIFWGSTESTPLTGPEQSKFLEEFLKRFELHITSKITEIKKNVDEIRKLQLKVLNSVNKQQTGEAEAKLADLCEENKRLARDLQVKSKERKCILFSKDE